MLKNYVVVKTQFEGFHYWKDAPEEVKFLRDLHRHIFHVRVEVPVKHENRDVEIILLKRFIDTFCSILTEPIEKKGLSCEQIATMIAKITAVKYNVNRCAVEVLEDGENGGISVYERV